MPAPSVSSYESASSAVDVLLMLAEEEDGPEKDSHSSRSSSGGGGGSKVLPSDRKPLLPRSMRPGNKKKGTRASGSRSGSPSSSSSSRESRSVANSSHSHSGLLARRPRLSFFSRDKSSRRVDPEHNHGGDDDEDPVMALFRARSTHRVRFALDPQQQQQHPRPSPSSEAVPSSSDRSSRSRTTSNAAEQQPSNQSLRKFVKNALFGSRRSADFDAEVAKFGMVWDPPPPSTQDEPSEQPEDDLPTMDPALMAQAAQFSPSSQSAAASASSSASSSPNSTPTSSPTRNNKARVSPTSATAPPTSPAATTAAKPPTPSLPPIWTERSEVRAQVLKLLNKAYRAQHVHFRYDYSVKCGLRALALLKEAQYPDDHPTVFKTLQSLNAAHHAKSSLDNSANIVKMGIKYEDAGDWIRALKMYTIAYRIRRDNLGQRHPSLVVLLNMLGTIQLKRNELEEAMDIFELALKEDAGFGSDGSDGESRHKAGSGSSCNILAKSVAYREMGIIYERWGDPDEALNMYHQSLECIAKHKGLVWQRPSLHNHHTSDSGGAGSGSDSSPPSSPSNRSPGGRYTTSSAASDSDDVNNTTISTCPLSVTDHDILLDLVDLEESSGASSPVPAPTVPSTVRRGNTTTTSPTKTTHVIESQLGGGAVGDDQDGMELCLAPSSPPESPLDKTLSPLASSGSARCYDVFFQPVAPAKHHGRQRKDGAAAAEASVNADVALTLHQIGQLHRAEGDYHFALAAYAVALRGTKEDLGRNHPNVAAILGNIGNLQKEMGDLTSAYETYQQVLAIESYRLGLSHPDVAVTLHNIATIDAARGNHQHALTLYEQVLALQKKLFGEDHISLAVTSTCMGDVYERIGNVDKALEAFGEALRIKTMVVGRHSIEVARILHKLGKLSALNGDVQLADSYLSRTILIYRLNKLQDDDDWMVEANRDIADIDAVIAMGRTDVFEC